MRRKSPCAAMSAYQGEADMMRVALGNVRFRG